MHKKIQSILDITSNDEEYNSLREEDHLFIVKGKDLDDNDLIPFVHNIKHHNWFIKLRKCKDGSFRIQNKDNNYGYCAGYVIAVSADNLFQFEKDVLMHCIKHGYQVSKLDTGPSIKEQNQDIFNNLFEEV